MKCVLWEDDKGYKHQSKIRDIDSDILAPTGVPCDPPNLEDLDWEAIKKELHNRLVDMKLFTWADVQRQQGIPGAIISVIKPRLVALYRTSPNGGDIKEAK